MDAVIMDLGDFIPEECELRFSIAGRKYECKYTEATVDEVYRILAETGMKDTMNDRRKSVSAFLAKCLTSGDNAKLADDLALLPYISPSGQLDIAQLYESITKRVKKNGLGETPEMK